jgi:hypothetical protein
MDKATEEFNLTRIAPVNTSKSNGYYCITSALTAKVVVFAHRIYLCISYNSQIEKAIMSSNKLTDWFFKGYAVLFWGGGRQELNFEY